MATAGKKTHRPSEDDITPRLMGPGARRSGM